MTVGVRVAHLILQIEQGVGFCVHVCAFMCVLCVRGSVEMCMRVHLHVHACGGQKSILDNSVTVQLIF